MAGATTLPLTVIDADGTRTENISRFTTVKVNPKIGTITITDLAPEDVPDDYATFVTLAANNSLEIEYLEEFKTKITNAAGDSDEVDEGSFYLDWRLQVGKKLKFVFVKTPS